MQVILEQGLQAEAGAGRLREKTNITKELFGLVDVLTKTCLTQSKQAEEPGDMICVPLFVDLLKLAVFHPAFKEKVV